MRKRTTLYMYSTTLMFDLILFIMTFPFVAPEYYYVLRDQSCVQQRGMQIKITLKQWMLIDASVVLSFTVLMMIVSILFMVSPKCVCFHTLHVWLSLILGLFRLAWLVVGGVLYWNDMAKRMICYHNIARLMNAVLISGYIYSVFYFLIGCLFPRPTIRVPKELLAEQVQFIGQPLSQRHLSINQMPQTIR